jgi:hypothetical protein
MPDNIAASAVKSRLKARRRMNRAQVKESRDSSHFACSKNENGPIFVQYSLVSAAGQAPSHLEACDAQ